RLYSSRPMKDIIAEKVFPSLAKEVLCTINRAGRTRSEYATSIRRSPIWNILVQSALSITLRHDGLLRIVQKDVTNWRLASADCVSGPSLRFVVQSPEVTVGAVYDRPSFVSIRDIQSSTIKRAVID